MDMSAVFHIEQIGHLRVVSVICVLRVCNKVYYNIFLPLTLTYPAYIEEG